MKNKYKLILPVFALLALTMGSTVYAFPPMGFNKAYDASAFTDLSAEKQIALEQAFNIRKNAETQGEEILAQAGITKEEVMTAVNAYHKNIKAKIESSLTNNDYNAYITLTQNFRMENTVTQEQFSKLVEARKLMQAGDKKGAMEILKDSGIKGPAFGMMGEKREGYGFGGFSKKARANQ